MNIGVFGVGNFGEKHINVLKTIKKFNIIGFFDINHKRAKEIEKNHNIKSYDDPITLIKKCDAIDIVTKTSSHFELIQLCIRYNKHIFIEKPICSKKKEIDNILKLTSDYSPVIQVGHIERYNPAMDLEIIEEISKIDSKRTGTINERNKDISIALDLMIHDIDLILNLTKSNIIEIQAQDNNKNMTHNDITCTLTFENGTKAILNSERGNNIKTRREMNIYSKSKTINIDFLKRTQTIKTNHKIKQVITQKDVNPLKKELIEFYENIVLNNQPKVGITEACNAVNIALEIDNLTKTKR